MSTSTMRSLPSRMGRLERVLSSTASARTYYVAATPRPTATASPSSSRLHPISSCAAKLPSLPSSFQPSPFSASPLRMRRVSPPSRSAISQRRTATTLISKPEQPEEPEVFRDGEPTIIATDRAINQLKRVSERENNSGLALRIAVEPGGCHGYQYKMEITEEMEEDDFQFEVEPGIRVVVDSVSLALVRGSTIDYVTELIGSQFAIKNNPQAKGAGCGCGVSWEPNV